MILYVTDIKQEGIIQFCSVKAIMCSAAMEVMVVAGYCVFTI